MFAHARRRGGAAAPRTTAGRCTSATRPRAGARRWCGGATGDRAWLARAERLAETLRARFLEPARGGFAATSGAAGPFGEALRPFDGNVAAARFL
jgi:hypothetical protein